MSLERCTCGCGLARINHELLVARARDERIPRDLFWATLDASGHDLGDEHVDQMTGRRILSP